MNFQASLLSSSLPINPPASGPSLTFSQSTQARNWLFTPTSLSTLRSEIATDSISDLTHLWQQEHLLQKQEANQDDPPPIPPKLEFPTVEESKALIDFWLAKIPPIVRAFGLPIVVETTAMTYLKRFFLRHPVWGFEVKDVMLTSLFLSLKSTNHPFSLASYARKVSGKNPTQEAIKEVSEKILALEFRVSMALDFEFWVLDPTRGVGGVLKGLEALSPPPKASLLSSLLPLATSNLSLSRLTDLEFHYSPSQITLASFRCISSESRALTDRWLDVLEGRAGEGRGEALESRRKWREESLKFKESSLQKSKAAQQKNGKAKSNQNGKGEAESGEMVEEVEDKQGLDGSLDLKEDELIDSPLGIDRGVLNSMLEEVGQVLDNKRREVEESKTAEGKEKLMEMVREIDRKCKGVADPREERVGGKLYQKRLQETSSLQQTKRSKKNSKASSKTADEDPFAEPSAASSGLASGIDPPIKNGGGGLFGAEIAKRENEKKGDEGGI